MPEARSFQPKRKNCAARAGWNTKRGFHGTWKASTAHLTPCWTSCWITKAQMPAPASAAAMPAVPETSPALTVARKVFWNSRLRATMASWMELYALTTKTSTSTRSGVITCGIP